MTRSIEDAWRRATEGFATRGGPLVRTSAAATPAEREAAWSRCVASLKGIFAAHHGAAVIDERFHVPEDYDTFMRVIGGGFAWPHDLDWSLFDAEVVAKSTADDFRLFVTDEEAEPARDTGLWLGIGWWSDKHQYLLCCDRAHSHYGVVLDGHDSHPWLNGVTFGGCTQEAPSFLEWLLSYGPS